MSQTSDKQAKVIFHTKNRIKWDSTLLNEKLTKATNTMQHELAHSYPNKGYLKALEGKIVFYLSRLHFLHQEERDGRIHKWDKKNGEDKVLIYHTKESKRRVNNG